MAFDCTKFQLDTSRSWIGLVGLAWNDPIWDRVSNTSLEEILMNQNTQHKLLEKFHKPNN